MNTRLLKGVFVFAVFALNVFAGKRDAQWKEVDVVLSQGQPKTAITRLETIVKDALKADAPAEALKALTRKIVLEAQIEGEKAEGKILRLQAALPSLPSSVKPLVEAILARWYWQYYQENQWDFMQRTRTAQAPGPDIKTWDLARIYTEIDTRFSAALADERKLKKISASEFDDLLLEEGNVPASYRPTLYDFLAYEALGFYHAGGFSLLHAEDEFEIDADGPAFGDVREFMNWQPASTEIDLPKFKAIRLHQNLLKFHQSDKTPDAFFDADLARLRFAKNVGVGENVTERYKAALERFIAKTAKHEVSARAFAALAAEYYAAGEAVEAHRIAKRGFDAFPQSAGGTQCGNLILAIESKSAQLHTESVWCAPWPTLNIIYRNISKVYFRAIPTEFHWHNRYGFPLGERLAGKPVLEWAADLPPTSDFKQRTEKLPAPTSLKPGYYLIVASGDPDFRDSDNFLSAVSVWVSDLALIIQTGERGGQLRGFVLDANSGDPIPAATVRAFDGESKKEIASLKTDENGLFAILAKERSVFVMAEHNGHTVAASDSVYLEGDEGDDEKGVWTTLFTDRALYRPGQTIHYKGLSLRRDPSAGKYSVENDHKVIVVFKDTGGQEIARAEHRTNDYGSFSGTFVAPRDRLMGSMNIEVLGEDSNEAEVRVEEYKRPKFEVEFVVPTEAVKLDTTVVLTGKATAFSGAAIGGAKVKWRVERRAEAPYWCWWWRSQPHKALGHGTLVTGPDGTFKVEFLASADRSVLEKNEPVFVYRVHADVTDTTGETRTASHEVRVGYTALKAVLGADNWSTPDKPVEFSISTTSLDSSPQKTKGRVKVCELQPPSKVGRAEIVPGYNVYSGGSNEPKFDPTNPETWDTGTVIAETDFETDASGKYELKIPLKAGIYRALLETQDGFGKAVTARCDVEVVDPKEAHYRIKMPSHFSSPKWTVQPGETFAALWGTGYERGRAYVEFECNGRLLKSYWTSPDRTQELATLPVTEDMRGGFTVRVTHVRENRAYLHQSVVQVPWTNKKLGVTWESFRSKLLPGQKETWTAVVTGPDAARTSAEMVATLYDASLDQFVQHRWEGFSEVFRVEGRSGRHFFQNTHEFFIPLSYWKRAEQRGVNWSYRSFPTELFSEDWGWGMVGRGGGDDGIGLAAYTVAGQREGGYKAMATGSHGSIGSQTVTVASADAFGDVDERAKFVPGLARSPLGNSISSQPDLSKVTVRKNLNETAFFFPHLTADENGVVRMTFTMPEALTEWKFLGFAHDKQLRAGLLTDKVTTSKDLMVEPNPPRFVREGDAIEFTVKVSNQSDQPQKGTVKLSFADAASLKSIDDALGNRATEHAFDVPAKQSRSYSWRIAVPDGLGFVTYKAVAATAQFSDGEEGFLPVLSKRILVTESLPLPIRGKATKQFEFAKLLASGKSDTLRHQVLTVQMTSQPAWYAVMALPYLMEYPHECSEQLFNRFYSNALARHIANSDPKIRRVFDLWKNTPALDSPLEKNHDLKALMLEETPWWREATAESQARRNLGLLFDSNRLDEESARALKQLAERQQSDGLWAWFPGGSSSEYISRYIVMGFGRLRQLGLSLDISTVNKALVGLDSALDEDYRRILKNGRSEEYVPSYMDAIYLYGRSFFLKDRPLASKHKETMDFFLRQARKFWLKTDSRQTQAHLAIALQRFGDAETPRAIMKSLKERSLNTEEMGMHWRDAEAGWWWYQAPIETQALMIEAFAEVANDAQAVEDCKVWLLKQKQTQNWKTTKATADAIYGLLLQGSNLLASDALVEVSLGGEPIKPEKAEAGTGFYEQKFVRSEIKPAMGEITVKKTDDGISWGSVHWQYLEDMSKVTPHEGTPLKLKKSLWIKETTSKGQVLKPVTGPVTVGDELVVRIELRVDRDMEYVHMKDQRGSGTEPVNVLSRYKWQDGLGYYESTRDTASHFFIDYLHRGTYVFEYSTRVQLKGNYQTGIAEIQCMYAPDFNSHSESIPLEVK